MTISTFVQQLDVEIDRCIDEAVAQGYRGNPRDYQLTEYDCLRKVGGGA